MVAKVTIDGRTYTGARSVSINNGRVIIDGVPQDGELTGVVELRIEGTLENLTTDASVTMNGNVTKNLNAGGSVNIAGAVGGDVDSGGSINIGGDVGGDVDSGGSVQCGNVKGNIDAGGSVRHM